jgi:hypothetical protein
MTCASSGEFIRNAMGRQIPGREVGRNEYFRHRQLEIATTNANNFMPILNPIDQIEVSPIDSKQDYEDIDAEVHMDVVLPELPYRNGTLPLNAGETLSSIMHDLRLRSREFKVYNSPLVFQHPPSINSVYHLPRNTVELIPNSGALPLQAHIMDNASFLEYQMWLLEEYFIVEALTAEDLGSEFLSRKESSMRALMRELEHLELVKIQEWARQVDLVRQTKQAEGAFPHVETGEYAGDRCMASSDNLQVHNPLQKLCDILCYTLVIWSWWFYM